MAEHDDLPQDGEAQESNPVEYDARLMASEPVFRRAVELVVGDLRAQSTEDCVDEQIIAECERSYDRQNPLNPWGLYESLKEKNPKAWVSPGVSLMMWRATERTAREALNEATRA